ncbi:tRNA (adenosine(37)-N6)-threonylcarbamoyltransferase complex transferase subunit TsaD [Dubosiella newyorkensis]|jgi:N6-L-threonylcarbamoyladenine synthase|uniref:tRNA (adenosine(37)-N6)-threonylcarbamoyltransferase complex transferase subunit TsaD n=1 Tax=Dubosiella newyorkensis TaxID=1862672 RepID=UPI0023552741|nr:tRNA (adenosine(37)-N6)-threonylcarbamoyltransferase complex transferase subunit TsaD [Dubosiella newyorkensis]MCI9041111.1 tRNA (adenosine(37)-N6)-threonylcarbamoyltransferase complex transferase subunit TsaD [Dubosiella newyorkensis]
MIILGIESSCDETAVAIVKDGKKILSSVVASQIDVHTEFGGVVPEVASRIHVENISICIEKALKEANMTMEQIDAIAVTKGPGLIGCLHVGVQAAKTLAFAFHKPLIPVHHLAGHIYANSLVVDLKYPLLALVVSGGNSELVYMKDEHSFEILGETQDDAIGEAYDKVARVLDLGYPGGPKIDQLAKQGEPIYSLPQPKTEGKYDFSFSGLKSGVLQFVKRKEKAHETFKMEDLAASFQETALNEIFSRVERVLKDYPDIQHFVVGGGVSANSRLREKVEELRQKYPKIEFTVPPMYCCTDNACMIAVAGEIANKVGRRGSADLSGDSSWAIQ